MVRYRLNKIWAFIGLVFIVSVNVTAQINKSSDDTFNDELAKTGIVFSHNSGFYKNAFYLGISTTISDANIIYTLDGTNPINSESSIDNDLEEVLYINPESTVGRFNTPAVIVRAVVKKANGEHLVVASRTFIFLDKVSVQIHPGGTWPTGMVNDQVFDFKMDQKITLGETYGSQMEDAMLDIPTVSVITDNMNLFDPLLGIYVNAMEHGPGWERECSVELINPDGTKGFNVNAGIRIRGGWSRHGYHARHAFRLFFREEYGYNKLYYPMFEEEGVDHFDKMDMRCSQNYAWTSDEGEHHTYVREVFNRDSQGAMGLPYTRSRYYHLYLNGMYWGVYQSQERADARFASDYLGGDNDDYDVVKVNGDDENHSIMATDGNLTGWSKIYNILINSYNSNAMYNALQGKNAQGEPIKNSEVLVDMDNLIDYMINIFYSGNFDGPVSAFNNNMHPNNMYAINNREDKSEGFRFFIHDSEHSLMIEPMYGISVGLNENRVNIGDRRDDSRMNVSSLSFFHIQWLHYKLTKSVDYRVRFADRAYKHFSEKGVYDPDECVKRFDKRAAQIDKAIIGESARWGDLINFISYTRSVWLKEINALRFDYFPYRTNIVIDQLIDADLYSMVEAPTFSMDGKPIIDDVVYVGGNSSCAISSDEGIIFYTTNGKDPRIPGGLASITAIGVELGSNISFNGSAHIKARVFKQNKWSALRDIKFIAEQNDFSNFKVTELHYHPMDSIGITDTVSDKNYEFIEFKNTSYTSAINLSGVVIDSAINFEFQKNTLLLPQQYYVVAAKPKHYYNRYGRVANGNYQNTFSNAGEQVVVAKGDNIIMDFTYSDQLPWPEEADGDGTSLVSVRTNPIDDPNEYSYWTSSKTIHGSPESKDEATGLIASADFEETMKVNVYPNPTCDVINVIDLSSNQNIKRVQLYNASGVLVYSQNQPQTNQLSFNKLGLAHGVYMLTLSNESSTQHIKIVYAP